MAASLQDWTDFQNDLMRTYTVLGRRSTPLYSELSGDVVRNDGVVTSDPSQERVTPLSAAGRETFVGGAEIRIPVQTSEVPGAAGVGRAGTWPITAPMGTAKATLKLCELVQPIGIDLALERDAKNGQYTARDAVESLTASAYRSLANMENDMLHGAGDGVLATQTVADAAGLVVTVGANANFDQLTIGRVVDIRTAAGALVAQGGRRKIKSVDRAAGTITLDTAQVADDGGSGNLPVGIVGNLVTIDSTFDTGSSQGKAMQGLGQLVTAAGTPFEGIDKADVGSWSAVSIDGAAAALSDDDLDDAVYQLSGNGVDAPDFGIAHSKTVDPYKASKTQFLMIQPQTRVVPSGFAGIVYQGANREFPIIKDLNAPRKKCRLVVKADARLYGDSVGPEFINDDGSMWRFFDRRSYKEAVIMDRVQLAVRNPAHFCEITNLSE